MAQRTLTTAAAAAEMIRRKRCQTSLHSFALNINIPGAPMDAMCPDEDLVGPAKDLLADHHALICTKLEETMNKPYGRLMLFLPPGSAKSSYANVALAWDMSRPPPPHQAGDKRLIMASYNDTIAKKQSRRVQAMCKSPEYQNIWDEPVNIVMEAAGEWSLSNGAEFMAAGLTSGITGNRADGVLIDDPVKNREDADSEQLRQKTIDEYNDSITTRLKPGAWIVIIQCMPGDTLVLMADGTERRLDRIKVDDLVATYDGGELSSSRVKNWCNNGPDWCFTITTSSGKLVRANARHPFLVHENGELKWVRTNHLRTGQKLVTIKASGESGKERSVSTRGVTSPPNAKAAAQVTTTNIGGRKGTARRHVMQRPAATRILSTAMGLLSKILTKCCTSKEVNALCVDSLRALTFGRIGVGNSASTTVMSQTKSEGYSATTVISQPDMQKLRTLRSPWPVISDFTLDEVVSVVESGVEDVFDIQVQRTENFIANGVVSHNTRWHELDLSGQLLPESYDGESGTIRCTDGMDWEVVNIPAKCERTDDPVGRKPGEYLWTDWFPPKHWQQYERSDTREGRRLWSSLYQQRPTPEGGGDFKREDFNWYNPDELPQKLYLYGASDYAVTEKGGDWSEHGVVGLDGDNQLWFVDWWSGQEETDVSVDAFLDLVEKYQNPRIEHELIQWINEGGVIDKAVRPLINRMMRERDVFIDVRTLPSMADKRAKCRSFGGRVSAKSVWLPKTAWAQDLVDQLVAMPAGRYDDKADVAGLIGRWIDQFVSATPKAPGKPRGIKPFTAAWLEYGDDKRLQQDEDVCYR